MHGFQRLRDAAVQHATLWRTDLSVCYLAQLIVGEVIAIRAMFTHDPFVPEFVQCMYGALGIGVADSDQEVEREFAANGRCQFDKRASGGRELQEATDEYRMHAWRKRSAHHQAAVACGRRSASGGLADTRPRSARTISTTNRGYPAGLMKQVQSLVHLQLTVCHLRGQFRGFCRI